MKQHFFTILAVWLCSGRALAEPLSQPDKDYVVLGLGPFGLSLSVPTIEGFQTRSVNSLTRSASTRRLSVRLGRSCA